jgi:PAS domain S-box-containing protein
MDNADAGVLRRALIREKLARKQAEKILEQKALELHALSEQLRESNKYLEQRFKEQSTELEGVFENIVDAYVVADLNGKVIKMNAAAVNLLESDFEEEEVNLLKMVDSQEVSKVFQYFNELLKKGAITDAQVQINTKSGISKLVHINCSLIYDSKGKPRACQGIVRDVTQKRKDQERLITSESRLSTLIQNLEHAVLLEDQNRKIVLTNKKFCTFFQIPLEPEQMVGFDCSTAAQDSMHLFSEPDNFVKRIDQILKNKERAVGDELLLKDGSILERDFIPITEGDKYIGHLWAYKDVTLRRSYRKSLEVQKEKYSNIIANMNLGLVEVDNEDRILMVNQSFETISGYKEEELIGKVASDIFSVGGSAKIVDQETSKRQQGASNSYELTINNKKGEERIWLISGAPNYDLDGKITGSIGIHLDITELKSLELQKETLLTELEKSNEELHEYAHVVSHDLKSPLRSIYALVSWLKIDNEKVLDEPSLKNISLIEETLEKMEALIGDILNYSSINAQEPKRDAIDLNIMISDILKMVHVPDHVAIDVLNSLPVIHGDKTKMSQLFQNLLSNAVKFLDKEQGEIFISSEDIGTHYLFRIQDNGMGIDKSYHEKIFKIFHTLEKHKDSTGIGLSIVKKIVESHGGKIWVESVPDKGATFLFTIKKG